VRTSLSPRTAVAATLLFALTACAGGEERDEEGRVSVGDLALAVPDGWEREPEDAAPPLVLRERFVDPQIALQQVQVVVGCDDSGVDALVGHLGSQPRGEVVITDAREHVPAPEVPGLDAVRRVTLDLGADPEVAPTFRTEGLYGERGDALVLVEVNLPVAGGDVDAEAVLDSLVVDGEALAERCAG
jgi:hypothetical protein